jgi:hypothetical protein
MNIQFFNISGEQVLVSLLAKTHPCAETGGMQKDKLQSRAAIVITFAKKMKSVSSNYFCCEF